MNPALRIGLGVLAVVALLVLLALLRVGPFAGDEPSASARPSPSAEPTSSAEASASESARETVSATSSPPPDAWTCGQPVTLEASGSDNVHTADVQVGTHPGFDQITFEYVEDDSPALEIHSTGPPFTQDGSGQPMTVNGTSFMELTLTAATKLADDGSLTYTGPTNFEPGFPQLVQLIERGDFEAVNSWYLGLNGGDCIRATVLTDPSRIVIDVQH